MLLGAAHRVSVLHTAQQRPRTMWELLPFSTGSAAEVAACEKSRGEGENKDGGERGGC